MSSLPFSLRTHGIEPQACSAVTYRTLLRERLITRHAHLWTRTRFRGNEPHGLIIQIQGGSGCFPQRHFVLLCTTYVFIRNQNVMPLLSRKPSNFNSFPSSQRTIRFRHSIPSGQASISPQTVSCSLYLGVSMHSPCSCLLSFLQSTLFPSVRNNNHPPILGDSEGLSRA